MPIVLSGKARKPREINIGYGMSITIRPHGFATMRELHHEARRRTEEMFPQLAEDVRGVLTAEEDGTVPEDAVRRVEGILRARTEEMVLALAGERLIQSWSGVFDEDQTTPVPFSPEAWRDFLDQEPALAQAAFHALASPEGVMAAEGNA